MFHLIHIMVCSPNDVKLFCWQAMCTSKNKYSATAPWVWKIYWHIPSVSEFILEGFRVTEVLNWDKRQEVHITTRKSSGLAWNTITVGVLSMGLLPDTHNCGMRMRRECRECLAQHQLQRKPLVSDPGMHRSTNVTFVLLCMSGSLTRDDREIVLGIPGACATRNFTYLVRGLGSFEF